MRIILSGALSSSHLNVSTPLKQTHSANITNNNNYKWNQLINYDSHLSIFGNIQMNGKVVVIVIVLL